MLQQAIDFRDESAALAALLDTLDERGWERETQFKRWTVNDIVAHLHFGNHAAGLSLSDSAAFTALARNLTASPREGTRPRAFTDEWLAGQKNRALLGRWREYYRTMAAAFLAADPKQRVRWFGPDMSVLSSITARLMETWAHGQAIYDRLGQTRIDTDRIKNIVVLGINTFGWTFANRGLPVPPERPGLHFIAPSGALWEWPQPRSASLIKGDAVEFCQVVTQVRNIADTQLKVVGETASAWMALAQCFAGPPENPPPPGTRFKQQPQPP